MNCLRTETIEISPMALNQQMISAFHKIYSSFHQVHRVARIRLHVPCMQNLNNHTFSKFHYIRYARMSRGGETRRCRTILHTVQTFAVNYVCLWYHTCIMYTPVRIFTNKFAPLRQRFRCCYHRRRWHATLPQVARLHA
jgi:hypothetical protein